MKDWTDILGPAAEDGEGLGEEQNATDSSVESGVGEGASSASEMEFPNEPKLDSDVPKNGSLEEVASLASTLDWASAQLRRLREARSGPCGMPDTDGGHASGPRSRQRFLGASCCCRRLLDVFRLSLVSERAGPTRVVSLGLRPEGFWRRWNRRPFGSRGSRSVLGAHAQRRCLAARFHWSTRFDGALSRIAVIRFRITQTSRVTSLLRGKKLVETEVKHELLAKFPVIVRIPVQWGDQDAFGHVNNTVPHRWFESARIALFSRIGLLDLRKEQGIGPILAAVSCEYRRQINFPDTVQVGIRVARVGRSSMGFEHAIVSESQNALVAEGTSTTVVFDYEAHKSQPVPDEIRRAPSQHSRPD